MCLGCVLLLLGRGPWAREGPSREESPPFLPSLLPCPNFIGGEWVTPAGDTTPVFNPSTGDVLAACPAGGAVEANAAVEAAQAAFPGWSETPAVDRARLFFRYRQLVEENFDAICRCVAQEHGKTYAEARGSAFRGLENIEYACGVPSLLFGDTLENLARGVDCETMLQPLGVCVGITPFNFPAMVPLWMYPLAIACGNTFVLKPSEKVPLTAVLLGQLLEKAGCPKGVFNIVHGGRACVDTLLTHPKVRAVSFVGSSPVRLPDSTGEGAAHSEKSASDPDRLDGVRAASDSSTGIASQSGRSAAAGGGAGDTGAGGSSAIHWLGAKRVDPGCPGGMRPNITRPPSCSSTKTARQAPQLTWSGTPCLRTMRRAPAPQIGHDLRTR